MALTSSGQLSLGEIRTELGSSATNFNLAGAAAGNFGTINQDSTNKPNSSAPHAVSEWYGYNHTAGGGGGDDKPKGGDEEKP